MSTFLIKHADNRLEYPLAAINLRKRYPNTSFPKIMSEYSNPEMGIYRFVRTEPPQSRYTHDPVEAEPLLQDGKYVQQWADGTLKPQEEIDKAWSMVLGSVKQRASELILAKYPEWKQRNMTMRVLALQNADTLTDDEQAELVAISAAWDEIDAIRAASDAVEADMQAMDIEAAMAYDIRSSDHWNV